jgi:hypothetical protein
MCDVQLRAWKECDFGHHMVCGLHFQKPETFSFGVGHPPLRFRVYMDLLWLWDAWNISTRRTAKDGQSESFLSSLCVRNWGLHTSFPNSLILLYLVLKMGGNQSKKTPFQCMLDNVKRGYTSDYGMELTPQKLWKFCQIDWVSRLDGLPRDL